MIDANILRQATLVFLVRRETGNIVEVCLAMKKRGFGAGRWNGVGGKVEVGESVEDAARRETEEEIGVRVATLNEVAVLDFYFSANPDWNQEVHVYLCEEWSGEPSESEEMSPRWWRVDALPLSEMWPDDEYWLPPILSGQRLQARFVFGDGDVILKKDIKVLNQF